ncbi:MAG: hypothetical protein ACF8TS_14320 [Maioricimonas sp. JB049]
MMMFDVRKVLAATLVGLTLLAGAKSATASTLIVDWAYRCNEDSVQVYLAAGGTGLQFGDQNFGFLRLTNQTANTQHNYAFPTYRTGWLAKTTFNALEGVVRANLESNENNIVRWIELTLPREAVNGTPGIPDGDTYTFFALSDPSSFIQTTRGWVTEIVCETPDVTPPMVLCMTWIDTLWPPNGKFVDIGLDCTIEDDVDPNPLVEVFVYCDEAGDAIISEDGVELWSRRDQDGDGRVYLIVVVATDAAGNVGMDCVAVTVPRDQSAESEALAKEQATFAEDYCREFGEVPENFTLIAQ